MNICLVSTFLVQSVQDQTVECKEKFSSQEPALHLVSKNNLGEKLQFTDKHTGKTEAFWNNVLLTYKCTCLVHTEYNFSGKELQTNCETRRWSCLSVASLLYRSDSCNN